METDRSQFIRDLMDRVSGFDYIRLEEIPDIALYMDQVTTFMDSRLESSKRYPNDKILTRTMINNYTKNHLLPPPDKKKYSTEHILLLIFIYYFKNFLSITDIQTLLGPLTERYFCTDGAIDLKRIYSDIFAMEEEQIQVLQDDFQAYVEKAADMFPDAPERERDYLQLFALVCMLSFDVCMKKQMIESIIDMFPGKGK